MLSNNPSYLFKSVPRFDTDFVQEGYAYYIKLTIIGDGGPDRPRHEKKVEGHCLVYASTPNRFSIVTKTSNYEISYRDLELSKVTIHEMRKLE